RAMRAGRRLIVFVITPTTVVEERDRQIREREEAAVHRQIEQVERVFLGAEVDVWPKQNRIDTRDVTDRFVAFAEVEIRPAEVRILVVEPAEADQHQIGCRTLRRGEYETRSEEE